MKRPSIDVTASHFFPEWQQGRKRKITIRHLLTYTSCLQDVKSSANEIAHTPNAIQLTLAEELICNSGSEFDYSNKSSNLLAGIVEKYFGKSIEVVANKTLFKPLGITDYLWIKDSAGNPYVMGGFRMKVGDLAKIGILVAHNGNFYGMEIISSKWIEDLGQPSLYQKSGLLWCAIQKHFGAK